MRPLHFVYDESSQLIFAGTNRGTVLTFDLHLNLLAASEPIYGINNLFMICHDADFIYAREITGKLVRWHKSDLRLDRVVDLNTWSDANYAQVPNVSHGLFIFKNAVYVSCPQGRVARFSLTDLQFTGISKYIPHALIESFALNDPNHHYAVDFAGYLYHGHIDSSMEPVARVAHGATHQILFDKLFDRYWVTDDFHCGIGIFRTGDVKNMQRIYLTNDDVEWMSFSADHSEILVACFDRFIYRLRNAEQPEVLQKIGPLNYQVKQVTWATNDLAFALTEAGDLYRIDLSTKNFFKSSHKTNAVWDIRKSSHGDNQYLVAFEDGMVRRIQVSAYGIDIVAERDLGAGMIRRLICTGNSEIFALSTTGSVISLDCDLLPMWTHTAKPLLRDFALADGRLLVGSENGELICLDAKDGTLLWQVAFDLPLWSLSISPDGQNFLAGHRLRQRDDQGRESTGTPGKLSVGDIANGLVRKEVPFHGNIKRIQWVDDDHFLLNGNGDVNTSLFRWPSLARVQRWSEWQLNTCEAAVVLNDHLYTTTYGYQLNTFTRSGECIDSSFPFEDYATSLASVGSDRLLAGGRGAFLALFEIREGVPALVTQRRF